jgi:DNA-3-methyladenine glycosylase I
LPATPKKKNQRLKLDAGIIRNDLKIRSAITNAQCYLELCNEKDSLSNYLWNFVDGKPIKNHWQSMKEIPANTTLSDTISKDLKKRGFKFVGSTIVYAYMQSMGIVNDHLVSCHCYDS